MTKAFRVGLPKKRRAIDLLMEEGGKGHYGVVDQTSWRLGIGIHMSLEDALGDRKAEWLFKSAEQAGSKAPKEIRLPNSATLLFEDDEGQLWAYP